MNRLRLLPALEFVLSFLKPENKCSWFKFSYTWLDGTTVIGIVRGNLQDDKNTVINLSSVSAFVRNSNGVFISEFLDILILSDNNHLTLDGSSLELGFTGKNGDVAKFLGSTSSGWFTTSLIIDRVRVIPFEPINSANWNMVQCFFNESQPSQDFCLDSPIA